MMKPLHLLLVEDSEDDAFLIIHALKKNNYAVVVQRVDTIPALQTALQTDSWDIVLADYTLSELNGLDVLNYIKQTGMDLPFIILSGVIDPAAAIAMLTAGAHDYIVKDDLTRLIPAIERELREAANRRKRRHAEIEIRQRNLELAMLNRIIVAAAAANTSLETLLNIACQELTYALSVTRITAALINEEQTTVTGVTEYGTPGNVPVNSIILPILPDTPLKNLLTLKEPLIIQDLFQSSLQLPLTPFLLQHKTKTLVILPLMAKDTLMGLLILESSQPREFTRTDIQLAWNVARQLAGAIARTRSTAQQQRLLAAIEQTGESIIITTTQAITIYVNAAFEKISGYTRQEVIGQNPRILQSGRHTRTFYSNMWDILTTGSIWHGRFINKKKDGTLYTEDATITPIRGDDGAISHYVAVKRDITAELQLEEQYIQAQKMEAVGRLTAGIAHDFNNLLTAINGFAELLQNRLPEDSPLQKMVQQILKSGQRAAGLVRQLLAFSRKQAIQPQLINLNETIYETEKLLQHSLSEQITLRLNLTDAPWLVHADPAQIEQVIINLAVNARDAMPNGGTLTISTANVTLDESFINTHLGASPGDHVQLIISDTGHGMSKITLERIFEPFFTTKDLGRGTGLGLASVFGTIKQNNGNIWVTSEEGHGTTFEIDLPRVEQTSPSEDQTPSLPISTNQPVSGTETILVAEDDVLVRELVKRTLQNYGYTILEAQNGAEALHLAQTHLQPIHLLITDIVMLELTGKTLTDHLAVSHPSLKTLFMSGYGLPDIQKYGITAVQGTFLHKPFTPMVLAHTVRRLLDS